MNEAPANVRQADIARVLGLSRAAVCKAVAKGMPTDSIEAAKAWRDARPRSRLSAKERAEIEATTPSGKTPAPAMPALPPTPTKLPDGDYNEIMVPQAGIVTLTAFQFYEAALRTGNTTLIAAAIKNWGEAGKVAGAVRERFIDLQEREKKLIGFDEVMCACAGEVAEWRRMLLSLGARLTGRITPEAARIVDAAVDEIMKRTSGLEPVACGYFAADGMAGDATGGKRAS